MIIKNKNVKIDKLHKEISLRFGVLDTIMKYHTGSEVVITSGHEGFSGNGVHKDNSKHYIVDASGKQLREFGQAIDIRSRTVNNVERCLIDLKLLFSANDFTV